MLSFTYLDNIALIEDDKSITYKELQNLVKEFEKNLVDTKSIIAIYMDTTINSVVAYLASMQKNYAILMLDQTSQQNVKLCELYDVDYVFDKELIKRDAKVKKIYKDLALLLPTSGSTGSPKFVRLSKENILHNTKSILSYLPITQTDTTITSLPLFYSYGLSVLNTHLASGATVVLTSAPLLSKEFWELFKKYHITNFNGVPYHYEMLMKLRFLKKEYKSLCFLTQAGGKLSKDIILEFTNYALENKKEFFVMYGQTEASARISYIDTKRLLKKPNSIGKAISGVKLFLQDDELIVKAKNVMLGYATNLDDLAKGDENKGILHTQDLGYKDEDGDFYITARASRFVKVVGNRINLDDIEKNLLQNSFKCIVVARDDFILVLTLNDDVSEIKQHLVKNYKLHHSLVGVKQIDEWVVKSNSKIDYKEMQQRYL